MFELSVLIQDREGALLRVLGTIERRGFTLGALRSQRCAQGMRVNVAVSSDGRAIEVLVRQLKRLCDVVDATFEIARPAFALPPQPRRAANAPSMAPSPRRSGLSFLGIPDRVSGAGGFA